MHVLLSLAYVCADGQTHCQVLLLCSRLLAAFASLADDAAEAFTVSSHASSSSSEISTSSGFSTSGAATFGSFGDCQALFTESMAIFPLDVVLIISSPAPAVIFSSLIPLILHTASACKLGHVMPATTSLLLLRFHGAIIIYLSILTVGIARQPDLLPNHRHGTRISNCECVCSLLRLLF